MVIVIAAYVLAVPIVLFGSYLVWSGMSDVLRSVNEGADIVNLALLQTSSTLATGVQVLAGGLALGLLAVIASSMIKILKHDESQ